MSAHVNFSCMLLFSLLTSVCLCVCVCLWATAALFINTSAGLTVHSGREREPWDSLRQRSHKKSLLIYFPPNWKVHAHTWLNHHASTGDGPPLHADETWSQFYRSGQSQACQGNTASRRIHTQFLMAFADVLFLIAPLALIPSSLYLTAHLIWPTLAIKPITIFFICGLRSLHVTSCFLPPSPVQPFASLYDSTSSNHISHSINSRPELRIPADRPPILSDSHSIFLFVHFLLWISLHLSCCPR